MVGGVKVISNPTQRRFSSVSCNYNALKADECSGISCEVVVFNKYIFPDSDLTKNGLILMRLKEVKYTLLFL